MPFSWPGYWSFALDRLTELADSINVGMIMTPSDHFVTTSVNSEIQVALQKAGWDPVNGRSTYDQLPVTDQGERVVGLAFVDELRRLRPTNSVNTAYHDFPACPRIESELGIAAALETLAPLGAALVMEAGLVVGLIHISDLNKHAAKSYFYLWLSAMEAGLATLVRRDSKGTTWINTLNEGSQVQVLGKLAYDMRHGIELDPIEYVDLSDLVKLAGETGVARNLGFKDRDDWRDLAGRFVDLRNKVMHPVHSVATDTKSVKSLIDRNRKLRETVEAIRSIARSKPI